MYDSHLIESILSSAGSVAMKYFGRVTPTWKENRTYVTEADLAVQDYLKTELESRFPDDGIVAEEKDLAKEPRVGNRRWIVDPIDGTASFVRGFPTWGIALGLLEGPNPVGGFFYMPVTGEYFATMPDGTLHKNGQAIRMKTPDLFSTETVLMADGHFYHQFSLQSEYTGKVRSLGSSVSHICYVATGSADAVLLLNVHIWDIAAGFAMLKANHGVMEYFDGRPVVLQDLILKTKAPDAILAGHPDTLAQFRAFIRRDA